MIRIDETARPVSSAAELRTEVERRSTRFRRRRRTYGAACTGSALLAVVGLIALGVGDTRDASTTRVGTDRGSGTGPAANDDDSSSHAGDGEPAGTEGRGGTRGRNGSGAGREPDGTQRKAANHPPSSGPLPAVSVPGRHDDTKVTKEPSAPPTSESNFKLLFDRDMTLHEMAGDGSGLRELRAYASTAHWAPDGNRAMIRNSGNDIELFDPGTRKLTLLFDSHGSTASEEDSAGDARWLPDNRTIVFVRTTGRTTSQVTTVTELWLLDAVDRSFQRVRAVEVNGLAVAPDGRIAYNCEVAEQWRLCLTDRSGADLGHVPNSEGHAATAAWSPDGRWIALTGADGTSEGLVLLRADGLEKRILLRERVYDALGARVGWFPDSSRVLFSLDWPDHEEDPCITAPPCPDDGGIWSIEVDGTDARPVPNTANKDKLFDVLPVG